MKTHYPVLAATILLIGSFLGANLGHAQGVTEHVRAAGEIIYVDQVPLPDADGRTDYTGFFLTGQGSIRNFGGSFLDEGVNVYLATFESKLSQQTLAMGHFQELVFGSSYTFPSEFYLGFSTPYVIEGQPVYNPRDLITAYGWARIGIEGNSLTVLDSGMDYSGQGIVVGTLTVIPEASESTLVLGVLAAAFCMVRRFRGICPQ